MAGNRKLPGVPNWMYEKPVLLKKKAIKDWSYIYLKGLSDAGQTLKSSKERIPGFIELLCDKDKEFKKIKPSLIVTTFKFIEGIREELKNKITKINKELDEVEPVQDAAAE